MGKSTILIAISLLLAYCGAAQQASIDSLRQELETSSNDTINLLILEKITNHYSETNPDSAFRYAEKLEVLAKSLQLPLEEVVALGEMGYALLNVGNYPRSLQTLLKGIAMAEDPESEKHILPAFYPVTDDFTDRTKSAKLQRLTKLSRILQYTGILYANSGNQLKSLEYYHKAVPLAKSANNLRVLSICYASMGRAYLLLKQPDSASYALLTAHQYARDAAYKRYNGSILLNLARVYLLNKNVDKAKNYLRQALTESLAANYYRGIVATHLLFADIFKQAGNKDSSLYHIRSGLRMANTLNTGDLLMRCYIALAAFYHEQGASDSAVKYQSLVITIKDSLFNSKQVQDFQNIDFNEQQQQQAVQAAEDQYKSRMQNYLLLGGLCLVLLIAVFLWRSNQHRQRSNALLKSQNKEIETAMLSLTKTQAQLIQAEKMASLGELTAGIAHEIQNPLNFVNNFSDVNTELIFEANAELENGNVEEVKDLLKDIRANEQKINHHGKRADSIVKGMLQHSRSSSGQKEATDINALVDEYLRLSYHGLRAKDKTFNADYKTDLDPTIGKVHIVPQDIGRVLLNLLNNAFYAVKEKQKIAGVDFKGLVIVSTKQSNNAVEIKVTDNGNGIPPSQLDKIFQPFFTTKPTGQGTGLGLSLSYDIVKAHNGELKVDTSPEDGTSFIINLPRV
jgi:two-component system, NtrC family, sensor kinase